MEQTLRELKTILREIILEVGDLKERVTLLEQAQQESRDIPGPARTLDIEAFDRGAKPAAAMNASQASTPSNLGRIYREGYHVCPMAFGEERSGECLFCAALLARGQG